MRGETTRGRRETVDGQRERARQLGGEGHSNAPPTVKKKKANRNRVHGTTKRAEVGIYLAPKDHVTCTYEDEFVPPPGKLTVRKLTLGGTGTFGFAVNPVTGKAATIDLSATTLEEGIAVDAAPAPELAPGEYTIAETSKPAKARGTWTETAVGCDNGGSYQPGKPISVKIESSKTLVCTLHQRTHADRVAGDPQGDRRRDRHVRIHDHVREPSRRKGEIAQSADVTHEKEPFLATGDPSNALFFEPYVMQEIAPPTTTGHWELLEVNCEGTSCRSRPAARDR